MTSETARFDTGQLEAYLSQLHGRPVTVLEMMGLSDKAISAPTTDTDGGEADRRSLKVFGYGRPVLIRYRVDGQEQRVVLHTAAADHFGHETRADRAAALLLCYDTFNRLPRHVPALDVGAFLHPTPDASPSLHSLGAAGEFFLLSPFVHGQAYAQDLVRLRDGGDLTDRDRTRAEVLARYLAEIHAQKFPVDQRENGPRDRRALYRRRIRDTVGSGEGIMGLVDNYPDDFPLLPPDWLREVEQACVAWRWRLKGQDHRLAQVHGDFHPFNVLFTGDVEFALLDRSRGAWGEPADDVSCMAINYLFFSLQRIGRLAPPFETLWTLFWETYLDATGDEELLSLVAPFLVWRGLVLASPVWYNVGDNVRRLLFGFIDHLLGAASFDPDPAAVNRRLVPVL